MRDHVHIFIVYKPSQSLPDLLRDIKANTSKFINEKKWINGRFQWQEGYGAFSYSQSHIGNVINYINNQEEHHKSKTFRQEYLNFLETYQVEFSDQYLFEWYE